MKSLIILCQLFFFATLLEGANILIVLPFSWYSHTQTFMPVFKELARRGHNVTMVSPFPQKESVPNWTDLTVNSTTTNQIAAKHVQTMTGAKSAYGFYPVFYRFCSDVMEAALQEEALQGLIKAEALKFDLVITQALFAHEPLVAFGHKFDAPVVSIYPLSLTPWLAYMTGNEVSFSLWTNFRTEYSNHLTFFQSIDNALVNLVECFIGYFQYIPRQEKLLEKYMVYPGSENRPSLRSMLKEISLHLIDYHFSVGYVDPLQPNTIPVGGLSVNHNGQLPKDLQELMDNSKNGVIYLSFGSFLRSSTLPKTFSDSLLEAFRKLDQTVLMKWDLENFPNKPKNVEVQKWFPQANILAHPNLRLFISHCGLHGVTEAAYFGVPVICVPFFSDQKFNAKFVEQTGFGLTLLREEINNDSFYNAITTILNNPRGELVGGKELYYVLESLLYSTQTLCRDNNGRFDCELVGFWAYYRFKEVALERSEIVKDRPHTALESAVYWIEYVLRHKGAKHLKPARLELGLYELFCLDIALFIVLLIAVPILVVGGGIKMIRQVTCKKDVKGKRD